MLQAIDISTSALVAQRQRMNTIAGNIANVHTTRDADGKPSPYQRRFVAFEADTANGKSKGGGTGVTFQIETEQQPPKKLHLPRHPDADSDGNVQFPNINLVTEFTNALEAARAYEANVAAIEMTKEMAELTMRILA